MMSFTQSINELLGLVNTLENRLRSLQEDHKAVTKQDLHEMEERLRMLNQEAVDLINNLSAATDTLSLKEDKVQEDLNAALAALQAALSTAGGTLTADQEAVVNKGKATLVAIAAAGDKADAAVAAADKVLPKPAPAGTP